MTLRYLRRLPVRVWRDTRGAAAVEFAVLAPLLMLMLLGTIEVARGVSTDRHFGAALSTAGDLVAREPFLGTNSAGASANLNSMMLSIKHLIAPYDASSLKLAIISVRASTTDAADTRVSWSFAYNGMDAPAKCSSYTVPANMIEKGGSVIVVEGSYLFKPLFGDFVPGFAGPITWTDKSFHSPRNSCVDYVEGDNCKTSC